MTMRIAILKQTNEGAWIEVVPGYSEKEFLPRLLSKIKDKLNLSETYLKHRWTKNEILKIAEMALNEIVEELKKETIKLV